MQAVLEELAREAGLTEFLDLIAPRVKPCVGFSLELGAPCSTGVSRFGGGPDLPAGFRWPEHEGRRLDFLMQVNLAEVAPHDGTGLFPGDGVLSFFYDLERQPWGYQPSDRTGHAVYYYPAGVDLARHAPPDPEVALPEARVAFWSAVCLPGYGSRDGMSIYDGMKKRILGLPEDTEQHGLRAYVHKLWKRKDPLLAREEACSDAFDELKDALFRQAAPRPDAPCHRLGGHSENVQGDMQREAQLVSHGFDCGGSAGYDLKRAEELEQTCDQWKLLLQVDTDDDCDVMWGDCGMLYFWAREADLAARDYGDTWMALQCG